MQLITVIYEILVLFPVLQTGPKAMNFLMLYHQNLTNFISRIPFKNFILIIKKYVRHQ